MDLLENIKKQRGKELIEEEEQIQQTLSFEYDRNSWEYQDYKTLANFKPSFKVHQEKKTKVSIENIFQIKKQKEKNEYIQTPFILALAHIKDNNLDINKDSALFDAFLFKIKLMMQNKEEDKKYVIMSSLLAFEIQLCLQHVFTIVDKEIHSYNLVFNEPINYEKYIKEYLDLFILEKDSQLHSSIIKGISYILNQDQHRDYEKMQKAIIKNFYIFILIINDCVNKTIYFQGQYPSIKSECDLLYYKSSQDANFLEIFLNFICQHGLRLLIDQMNNLSDLINPIITIFMHDISRKKYFNFYPKSIHKCGLILVQLVKSEQEISSDYSLLDKIIDKINQVLEIEVCENFLGVQTRRSKKAILIEAQATEYYQYYSSAWEPIKQKDLNMHIALMLNLFNSLFRDDSKSRNSHSRPYTPQLARKILDFSILTKVSEKYLKGFQHEPESVNEQILLNSCVLVYNICGEIPNFIDKLVEEGIIQVQMNLLRDRDLPQDTKSILQIINFMNHVSLKESGKVICEKEMVLEKIFNIFTNKNYVNMLHQKAVMNISSSIIKFASHDHIKEKVVKLILETNQKMIDMENLYLEKFEHHLEYGSPIHQNFPFEIYDFALFGRMIHNYCKFIKFLFQNEMPIVKYLIESKCLKTFFKIVNFPLLGLFDLKENKNVVSCMKTVVKQPNQDLILLIFTNIETTIEEVEQIMGKPLDKLTDLSTVFKDILIYLTKTINPIDLIKEKIKGLYQILRLTGKLNFLEGQLEVIKTFNFVNLCKVKSQNMTLQDLLEKLNQLYKIISNQICIDQLYYFKVHCEKYQQACDSSDIELQNSIEKDVMNQFQMSFQTENNLNCSIRKLILFATQKNNFPQKTIDNRFLSLFSNLLNKILVPIQINKRQIQKHLDHNCFLELMTDLIQINIQLLYLIDLATNFQIEYKQRNHSANVTWPAYIIHEIQQNKSLQKLFTEVFAYIFEIFDDINILEDMEIKNPLVKVMLLKNIDCLFEKCLVLEKQFLCTSTDINGKILYNDNLIQGEQVDKIMKLYHLEHLTIMEKMVECTSFIFNNKKYIKDFPNSKLLLDYQFEKIIKVVQNQQNLTLVNIDQQSIFEQNLELEENINKLLENINKKKKVKKGIKQESNLVELYEQDKILQYNSFILIRIGAFLLENLFQFNELESQITEYILSLQDKLKENSQKLSFSNEVCHILAKSLKKIIGKTFKKFEFKLSKFMNLKQKIKDQKTIEINVENKSFLNEKIQQINILTGILFKICERSINSQKNHMLKEDSGLEYIKLAQKLVVSVKKEIKKEEFNVNYYNQFFYKLVTHLYQIFSNNKIEQKQIFTKTCVKFLSQYLHLINFCIVQSKPISDDCKSIQSVLILLIKIFKMDNSQIANFYDDNGLIELYKLTIPNENYGESRALTLFSKLFKLMVVDNSVQKAQIESSIKYYFYKLTSYEEDPKNKICETDNPLQKTLKKMVTLDKFVNNFQRFSKKTAFIEIGKQICLNFKVNATSNKPSSQMIKLKDNSILYQLESVNEDNIYKFKDEEVNQSNFAPNKISLNILNQFLEHLVTKFTQNLQNESYQDKSILNIVVLVNSLNLLIQEYPILIPTIIRFNTNKILKNFDLTSIYPLINTNQNTNFLQFFIKGISFHSMHKFNNFLLTMCVESSVLIQQNKQYISYNKLIQKKLLSYIYKILNNQLQNNENIFKNSLTVHNLITYGHMHLHMLSLQEIARQSICESSNKENFFKLYQDYFKQIQIDNYYQVNRVIEFLIQPLQIMHQYQIFQILNHKRLEMQNSPGFKKLSLQTQSFYENIFTQLTPQNSFVKDQISSQWNIDEEGEQQSNYRRIPETTLIMHEYGQIVQRQIPMHMNELQELFGVRRQGQGRLMRLFNSEQEQIIEEASSSENEEDIPLTESEQMDESISQQVISSQPRFQQPSQPHIDNNNQEYDSSSSSQQGIIEEDIIQESEQMEIEGDQVEGSNDVFEQNISVVQEIEEDDSAEHAQLESEEIINSEEGISGSDAMSEENEDDIDINASEYSEEESDSIKSESPKEKPSTKQQQTLVNELELDENIKSKINLEHLGIAPMLVKIEQKFEKFIQKTYSTDSQNIGSKIYQNISQIEETVFNQVPETWNSMEKTEENNSNNNNIFNVNQILDHRDIIGPNTLADLTSQITRNDNQTIEILTSLRNNQSIGNFGNRFSNIFNNPRVNQVGSMNRQQNTNNTQLDINWMREQIESQFLNDNQNIQQNIENQESQSIVQSEHWSLANLQSPPQPNNVVIPIQEEYHQVVEPQNTEIIQQDSINESQQQGQQQNILQEPQLESNADFNVNLADLDQIIENVANNNNDEIQENDVMINEIQQNAQQFLNQIQPENNNAMEIEPEIEAPSQQQIIEEEKTNVQYPESLRVLQEYNLTIDFLTDQSIDKEYFEMLPNDFRVEIIKERLENIQLQEQQQQVIQQPVQQQQPQDIQNQNLRQALQEALNNVRNNTFSNQIEIEQPLIINAGQRDDIQVIRDEENKDNTTNNTNTNNTNNQEEQKEAPITQVQAPQAPEYNYESANWLATLDSELREDILLTSPNDYIEGLPPDIRQEAYELRNRGRHREFTDFQIYHPSNRSSQRMFNVSSQNINSNKKKQKRVKTPKEIIQKDKQLSSKLALVDEQLIMQIVRFLYLDNVSFLNFPFVMLQNICMNSQVEYKILDCFMWILKNKSTQLQDFPLRYLYLKDQVITDYEKVFDKVSLKILFLISKNENSFPFNENKRYQSLNAIQLYNPDQNLSFFIQLINLIEVFDTQTTHLQFLVTIISNFTKHNIEKKKNDLKISQEAIYKLCKVLTSDYINTDTVSKLSEVISNLCLQKPNLSNFIEELKNIIIYFSKDINNQLVQAIVNTNQAAHVEDSMSARLQIIKSLEKSIINESKVYKIFFIIKNLFEKCQNENKELTEKDKIREIFSFLMNDELLTQLYVNVIELFNLLDITSNNLIGALIDKFSPILECFFIIFQIMFDNDEKKLDEKRKISNINQENQLEQNDLTYTYNSIIKHSNTKHLFDFICEKGKSLLNIMIKHKLHKIQSQKMTGCSILKEPIGIIFKRLPQVIDFENKKNFFKNEIKQYRGNYRYQTKKIRVKREDVFTESYYRFEKMNTNDLKSKLQIEFFGEEGFDAGGLIREWYMLLSKAIFNPLYPFFLPTNNGNTFQPNPNSSIDMNHLKYFRFIGQIVGKALLEGYMLDAYFTRSFYKHMLGADLCLDDMQDIDPTYYKNLNDYVLNGNPEDLDITWSYEVNEFDVIKVINLIPNGENIMVTNENKNEFLKLLCEHKMGKEIEKQLESFLEGFHQLIPHTIIRIFDSKELELLISGLPDIDIVDLKANTEYTNFSKNSQIIKWFWEVISTFDNTQKANFLQFVTGTSKVPLEGFVALRGMQGIQKFQIHKAFDTKKLPTAHTCFNQLDLPEYETKEELSNRLNFVILEGKEGFGHM